MGLLRAVAAAALSVLVGLAATLCAPSTAQAQPLPTCSDVSSLMSATIAGGAPPVMRQIDFGLVAGQVVTIIWDIPEFVFLEVEGVPLVSLTRPPPGSANYTIPTTGTFTLRESFTPDALATTTILVTCSGAGTPPTPPVTPTPPTPPAATDAASLGDGALGDQDDREQRRYDVLWHALYLHLGGVVFEDSPLGSSGDTVIISDTGPGGLPDDGGSLSGYAPIQSPINRSVPEVLTFLDFGGDSFSGTFPLATTDDWRISLIVDGAAINRGTGGLTRQTRVGSATILGSHLLDDKTTLGVGLKLGGANSVTNAPASTVNSLQVGADLAIAHMLMPDLFGGLYLGAEAASHAMSIGGVTSTFGSQTLKLGGTLEGQVDFDAFTLSPAVSALLQLRHRNGFTDSVSVAHASSNAVSFDVTAGATLSRDFEDIERGLSWTPFLTGNLLLNASGVTPAPAGPLVIPPDVLRVQVIAGVRARWDNGMTVSLQGDIARGPTTTMFGLSGTLSVPIN
jgi:hypothetical protein